MPITRFVVAVVVLCVLSASSSLRALERDADTRVEKAAVRVEPSELSYDEFMRLSNAEQRSRFRTLTPENKALLKRTHAERWLRGRDGELTAPQRRAAAAVIEYLTADLYMRAGDAQQEVRERELVKRLRCAVGRTQAREMLMFNQSVSRPAAGVVDRLESLVDEWMFWLVDCAL